MAAEEKNKQEKSKANSKEIAKDVKQGDNEVPMEAEVLDEMLENVPPEHRKYIERMMISSVQMHSEISPEQEVMKKNYV